MMNPITALINFFWDDNDRSLSRQEIASQKSLEFKLKHYEETGETTPPKERLDTLNRGSDATSTAWMRELLDKYQLYLDGSLDGQSVRLVDTKYEGLANNTVKVDMGQLLGGGYAEWYTTIRAAHYAIRSRAIRAGLQKPFPRRGNPGKGVNAA